MEVLFPCRTAVKGSGTRKTCFGKETGRLRFLPLLSNGRPGGFPPDPNGRGSIALPQDHPARSEVFLVPIVSCRLVRGNPFFREPPTDKEPGDPQAPRFPPFQSAGDSCNLRIQTPNCGECSHWPEDQESPPSWFLLLPVPCPQNHGREPDPLLLRLYPSHKVPHGTLPLQ